MCLHVNCTCAIGSHLNLDLLCVAQYGVLEPHLAKTATLASLQAERGYYDESKMSFCA